MGTALDDDLAEILPLGARVSEAGHLVLGGVDVAELAARFGTPLYIYDEATIRTACRAYMAAFSGRGRRLKPPDRDDPTKVGYVAPQGTSVPVSCHDTLVSGIDGEPRHRVHYASKAYLATWLCKLLLEEGLGFDVVGGGELHMALAAGVPAQEIRLHGNNKGAGELRDALDAGVGRVVVDNMDELSLLAEIARGSVRRAPILLRLAPGVEAHTHEYLKTGLIDSKFGLPISTPGRPRGGDALPALRRALVEPMLDLYGYHAHVGTGLLDPEPVAEVARRLLDFARLARAETGYWPREISPGGGLGIAYVRGERVPAVSDLARRVLAAVAEADPPVAVGVEPGRSIVGRAGVALYTVGARKSIEGMRSYVAVDGGMADNIRPALYGATYTPLAATRMGAPPAEPVTVAGRYCESGDILVRDAALPAMEPGDLLALPAAGAYCLPMSSAYNGALRPAVVVVNDGTARLVQRRATYADLLTYDLAQ
ncbi:MAG TPA: diaminopimelate decarboxylase [Chloroflexota bacterium]|nr:diaminopimelate decarboxylase [Chloroflexota bacterium]